MDVNLWFDLQMSVLVSMNTRVNDMSFLMIWHQSII